MQELNLPDLIVYQDDEFIVINKPPTIPVQPDLTGDPSLLDMVEAHCGQKINVVHRIDRPVSGLVIFPLHNKATTYLSSQFAGRKIQKTYLAVTEAGREGKEKLTHYLLKLPGTGKVVEGNKEDKKSRKCELKVHWIGKTDRYAFCEVSASTGHLHQIRAQLSLSGAPIKGDVKYGARRKNADRSIHLHAWKMAFFHPVRQQTVELEAPLPSEVLWDIVKEKVSEI